MMSPDNNNSNKAAKQAGKDETQSSTGRKTATARPQEPALKCPRCDSPNTKFCYYNNYSLTQPRHFCKTCRRYWTKGGALRNVPIGGGCRKNKKLKSNSPRISGDSKDSNGSSSDIGGLKFFQGISPAMDFQLGGINMPKLHPPNTNLFTNFSSFGEKLSSPTCFTSQPEMGLTTFPALFPSPPLLGFQEIGSFNQPNNNLASSIESLSSINQDLHWKLQQQRLAMLYVGENNNQKDKSTTHLTSVCVEPFVQKPQSVLFQNLDVSKEGSSSCGIGTSSRKEGGNNGVGNLATEWFFDNTFTSCVNNPITPTSGSNNGNENNNNTSNWSGVQGWSDLNHYTTMP